MSIDGDGKSDSSDVGRDCAGKRLLIHLSLLEDCSTIRTLRGPKGN